MALLCRVALYCFVLFLVGCGHTTLQKDRLGGYDVTTPLDKENQPNGLLRGYDSVSGKLAFERGYKAGRKEGVWREYYPNSQLKYEGYYKNNLPNGTWRFFYEDGTLQQEEFYRDGKMDGIWKYYDRSGKLTREVHYPLLKEQ